MDDFYAVLEVQRTASSDEIKEAYRRMVRLHHPDANPSRRAEAELRVKAIFLAYATLSDPHRRRQHDIDLATADRNVPEVVAAEAAAQSARNTPSPPLCLMRKVREILQTPYTEFAHQLGLSEAMLQQLETRDGIPQGTVQMRTFTHLVETAAKKLETEGRVAEANGLRSSLQRKKNQRAIYR